VSFSGAAEVQVVVGLRTAQSDGLPCFKVRIDHNKGNFLIGLLLPWWSHFVLFLLEHLKGVDLDPAFTRTHDNLLILDPQGCYLAICYFDRLRTLKVAGLPDVDVPVDPSTDHIAAEIHHAQHGGFGEVCEHSSHNLHFLILSGQAHEPQSVSCSSHVKILANGDAFQKGLEGRNHTIGDESPRSDIIDIDDVVRS
jgi:hypothetical protein